MAEIGNSSTAQEDSEAALTLVAGSPGARIFVYIDTGPETEITVFASGDPDEAADIIASVGDWLDPDEEDDDGD